jgi:hypothetical protein
VKSLVHPSLPWFGRKVPYSFTKIICHNCSYLSYVYIHMSLLSSRNLIIDDNRNAVTSVLNDQLQSHANSMEIFMIAEVGALWHSNLFMFAQPLLGCYQWRNC